MLNDVKTVTRALRARLRDFISRDGGEVNIVAVVVLIGIALILAILFRRQIQSLLETLFESINQNAENAISEGMS
ncbi:MAG: flagellin-like protein [Oscillospiraceae bacterium]|jgi:hypothetical protein|nr:flagellin-like protein [Oscillospiraceae bacterium]